MLKKCVKYQPSWQCKMYTLPKHQTRPDHLSIFFFFSLSLTSPTYTTTQALLNIFFSYIYLLSYIFGKLLLLSLHIIQLTLFFCKILSLSLAFVCYMLFNRWMVNFGWNRSKKKNIVIFLFISPVESPVSVENSMRLPCIYTTQYINITTFYIYNIMDIHIF